MKFSYNLHKNIMQTDDITLVKFMNEARRLAEINGHEIIYACIAQATIDMSEEEFTKTNQLQKCDIQKSKINFHGDHRKLYKNNDMFVYRTDEYSLAFNAVVDRIQYYWSQGLDGEITGKSIHLPSMTFGVVARESGKIK